MAKFSVFRQNNANDVTMTSLLAKTASNEILQPKIEHPQFVRDHFAKKSISKAQSLQNKKESVLKNRRKN